MKEKRTLLAGLLCGGLFAANAQVLAPRDTMPKGDSLTYSEVVITAYRSPQKNYLLPVVTTVIAGEQAQQRGLRTVPEALFGTSGVFLQKTNHGGGSPFLRGLTGQQTLLMVDGIRLNNATFRSGPNQYLNTIDPSWIERTEVLHSSGAAEYGSDAIGGVVHVLTHQLQPTSTTQWQPIVGFKYGSGGMETSGQAALRGSGKRWAMRVGGAYRNFGDLIAGKGLGKESPSAYTQWSGEAKIWLQLSKQWSLTAAYQDLQQTDVPIYHKVQLENFLYNKIDPQRRRLVYVRAEGDFEQKLYQKISLTASKQQGYEVRNSQKNNAASSVTETDRNNTFGLQLSVLSQLARPWSMVTGIDWYADAVESKKEQRNLNTGQISLQRGLYPDQSIMNSLAAYNLHTCTFRRWTLTGGLRFNAFRLRIPDETIGVSEITPSALVGNFGSSYALFRSLRVYANIATAFRTPNVDDLGTLGIVDFRYELPNTALRPERSRSVEAGFKIQTGSLTASAGGYYLQLRDLIGRVRTADTLQGYAVYQKENIADAYIQGMNAQFDWHPVSKWRLNAHTTYTFGQNTTAKEPLRRIPPLNGAVSIAYAPVTYLLFRAETVFAAAQRRLAKGDIDDNRIADDGTPGWQIFNLIASHSYKKVAISVELHNLSNTAYRTHGSGIDGMGRSMWLRLAWGM